MFCISSKNSTWIYSSSLLFIFCVKFSSFVLLSDLSFAPSLSRSVPPSLLLIFSALRSLSSPPLLSLFLALSFPVLSFFLASLSTYHYSHFPPSIPCPLPDVLVLLRTPLSFHNCRRIAHEPCGASRPSPALYKRLMGPKLLAYLFHTAHQALLARSRGLPHLATLPWILGALLSPMETMMEL